MHGIFFFHQPYTTIASTLVPHFAGPRKKDTTAEKKNKIKFYRYTTIHQWFGVGEMRVLFFVHSSGRPAQIVLAPVRERERELPVTECIRTADARY